MNKVTNMDKSEDRLNLYKDWVDQSVISTSKRLVLLGLLVSAILLIGDAAIYGLDLFKMDYAVFAVHIVWFTLFNCAALYLSQATEKNLNGRIAKAMITILGIAVTASYIYLSNTVKTNNDIVNLGTMITIFATNVILYRYWKMQTIITLSVIGVCTVYFAQGFQLSLNFQFIIFSIIAGILSTWLRKNFIDKLYHNLEMNSLMYPPEIGRALVISPKKDYILKKFEPKKRPVSVLVSDWRSFQSFCQNNSSEYVARSLNSFQDAFREEVSKRISGGSFYLEFIADMAFLIIYSKKDSREEVLENKRDTIEVFF